MPRKVKKKSGNPRKFATTRSSPSVDNIFRKYWYLVLLACSLVVLLRDNFLQGVNLTVPSQNILNDHPTDASSSSAVTIAADFQQAYDQSYSFFDDIPVREWKLLKQRVLEIQPNTCSFCRGADNANAWFQNHYEPEFACRHERRIGRLGDGGKWICDPHRLKQAVNASTATAIVTTTAAAPHEQKQPKPCLVYSVGSNNDFSFEEAIQSEIGKHCEIHTFDPTDYSEKANEIGGIQYHTWGIDKENKKNRRNWIFKTLKDTIEELGHIGRTIDIFKIDCEGCELSSYRTWVNPGEVHNVILRQVLVEVHGKGPAPGKVQLPVTSDFFKGMYDNGYVIFHKEPNIHYWKYTPCVEYAFLKLSSDFFVQ